MSNVIQELIREIDVERDRIQVITAATDRELIRSDAIVEEAKVKTAEARAEAAEAIATLQLAFPWIRLS